MDSNVKSLWLEALRSGKYEQGVHTLNSHGKFCCLGVLCEIAIDSGVVDKQETDSYVIYDGYAINLPSASVIVWADLPGKVPDPEVTVDGNLINLTTINDSGDYNFNQIADIIEEQL